MNKVLGLLVVLGIGLVAGFSTGYEKGFERGVEAGKSTIRSENLVLDKRHFSDLAAINFVVAEPSMVPVFYDWEAGRRYVVLEIGRWGSAATGFETSGYVETISTDPIRAADGKLIGVVDYRIPGR